MRDTTVRKYRNGTESLYLSSSNYNAVQGGDDAQLASCLPVHIPLGFLGIL